MKTNNLKFNTKKEINFDGQKCTIYVSIRLNDECKNGHQDFAITGDIYKGKGTSDRAHLTGGCIHEEIIKYFPEFEPFVNLHLCDFNGVPMHAIANGHYHMKNGYFSEYKKETPEQFKKKFCEYYRVTPEQYEELKKAKDQNYFGFLLVKLGVLEQWQNEAKEAIKILEGLTGDEFINDSQRSQFHMKEEELNEIENKVSEGFYTEEKMNQREQEKKEAKKQKMLGDLTETYNKKLQESLIDFEIDKILINLFLTSSNVIFYKHQNKVVFNWSDSTYDKKYTEVEFNQFLTEAKKIECLTSLEFELK